MEQNTIIKVEVKEAEVEEAQVEVLGWRCWGGGVGLTLD